MQKETRVVLFTLIIYDEEDELGAPMARNMVSGISEDLEEFLRASVQSQWLLVGALERSDHNRDNTIDRLEYYINNLHYRSKYGNYPLDDLETVGVVSMKNVSTHEGEYRHNVMKH